MVFKRVLLDSDTQVDEINTKLEEGYELERPLSANKFIFVKHDMSIKELEELKDKIEGVIKQKRKDSIGII